MHIVSPYFDIHMLFNFDNTVFRHLKRIVFFHFFIKSKFGLPRFWKDSDDIFFAFYQFCLHYLAIYTLFMLCYDIGIDNNNALEYIQVKSAKLQC